MPTRKLAVYWRSLCRSEQSRIVETRFWGFPTPFSLLVSKHGLLFSRRRWPWTKVQGQLAGLQALASKTPQSQSVWYRVSTSFFFLSWVRKVKKKSAFTYLSLLVHSSNAETAAPLAIDYWYEDRKKIGEWRDDIDAIRYILTPSFRKLADQQPHNKRTIQPGEAFEDTFFKLVFGTIKF